MSGVINARCYRLVSPEDNPDDLTSRRKREIKATFGSCAAIAYARKIVTATAGSRRAAVARWWR
jgi:hypothetical protein